MKQVRLYGPDDLRLDEMPDPVPGSNDVVVKVHSFGICGSDLNFKKEGHVAQISDLPVGLGHEFVGTIASAGQAVKDLQPGMRVTVNPLEYGNGIGLGAPEGAFAEYVLVKDARRGDAILPLPESLSFDRAVLTEPIAVATHGINLGEFPLGGRAVVFGAGPIGLAAVAVLKYRRASRIAIVDVVPERLERARVLGAHAAINARECGNVQEALTNAMGGLVELGLPCADVDLFIDAAGAPGVVVDCINLARPKGRSKIVVVAHNAQPIPLDGSQLLAREISIRGSRCYPTEFPEVIRMLADPDFNIEPMISHHFKFKDFFKAVETAENGKLSAKVVVHLD